MADNNQTQDDLESRYLQQELMDFTEEELAMSSSSMRDSRFDTVVGHIEDIIMEEEFNKLQNEFLEKYYLQFEDTEENKFVYTDIHKEYCELVEKYIETELAKRVNEFNMEDFAAQLVERKESLDGEIFEMLMTFNDFMSFKEMLLDYRAMKENKTVDLSAGLTVTPLRLNNLHLTTERTSNDNHDANGY